MTEIGRALRERAEMLETSQRAHEFTWTEILAGELRLSQEMRD